MVAIPVGPVGLLIIQRTLSINALAGFASGLGAALADGLFGFLAALGLVTIIGELEATRSLVRPLGSLALLAMGLYFCFKKPPDLTPEDVLSGRYQRRYWWDTITSFFLTLLNPTTIIAFALLFAGSDLVPEDPSRIQYFEVTLGVFVGSLAWWLILVTLASPVKAHLSKKNLHRVFELVGIILMGLALFSLGPRIGGFIDKMGDLIKVWVS